jgi:hypothetical protein
VAINHTPAALATKASAMKAVSRFTRGTPGGR